MIRDARRVTMGTMRWSPLLLTLLCAACATATPLETGDRLFRTGRYVEAYQHYAAMAAEGGATAQLEARIESARFEMVLEHARELLHRQQPHQVLEVLGIAEQLRPGHPDIAALRLRAHRKVGVEFAEEGRQRFDEENPHRALAAYEQALVWDPENALAQEGLGLARARLEAMERLGEEFFFLGLDELDRGSADRARTAFQHATTHWGEESRAAELLEELSQQLAERSLIQARQYLAMGLIGQAWMALRDADHLRPGVPEVEQRLVELEAALLADLDLDAAELALRGGYPDRALEAVSAALAREALGVEDRTARLSREAEQLRVHQDYVRARACEIDGLMVRAVDLLRAIASSGEAGYEDVPLRLEQAEQRLASAADSYRQALAAESAGDRELYLEQLRATVRAARDYQDASWRLRLLTAEAGG